MRNIYRQIVEFVTSYPKLFCSYPKVLCSYPKHEKQVELTNFQNMSYCPICYIWLSNKPISGVPPKRDWGAWEAGVGEELKGLSDLLLVLLYYCIIM